MNLSTLKKQDNEIYELLEKEYFRQNNSIELIASENIASKSVMEAQSSILTNKYAEGYPGKRYYGGCIFVDEVEKIAIERAKKLFNSNYANVQPHSGSQANQAVLLALSKAGDVILGMSLDSGGHLTHGSSANLSGKWFDAIKYNVDRETNLINYEEVEKLAMLHKPKIIIAGGSAYPRKIDFAKFREIADQVGAYLLCDIAHYSGLIATNHYPSPVKYADVITTTTHKTLRGPRGGMILCNDEIIAKKIDSAIFPGLQGGPLMHIIAAKAVAFGEALQEDFSIYCKKVIDNAQILCKIIQDRGFKIITDGTDCHLILLDLRSKNITGKMAEQILEKYKITCNKNTIPFDKESPFITSGLRIGSAASTSRGFGIKEFEIIGNMIADILEELAYNNNLTINSDISDKIQELCKKFPINIR